MKLDTLLIAKGSSVVRITVLCDEDLYVAAVVVACPLKYLAYRPWNYHHVFKGSPGQQVGSPCVTAASCILHMIKLTFKRSAQPMAAIVHGPILEFKNNHYQASCNVIQHHQLMKRSTSSHKRSSH
jgi:hypothetical protein